MEILCIAIIKGGLGCLKAEMIIVRHNGIGVGCINFLVRRYSNKRYSDSLNLPKTGFPLTLKDGAAVKREKDIQKVNQIDNV